MSRRRSTGLLTFLCFGYAFLYLPLVSVIVYSFNDSRLVTIWGFEILMARGKPGLSGMFM